LESRYVQAVFLLFLLGGFFLLLYYIGVSGTSREIDGIEWREAEEDVHLDGVHFKEWKKGTLLWDLEAQTAKYYHKQERAFFHGVSLMFHPPEDGVSMTLHADTVVYDMGPRLLKAEGNVWGEGEQGFRFYTDSLSYEVDKKSLKSQDKVVLKKDRLTIEGKGLTGSLIDQTFVLLSSVRTVFQYGNVAR
jgi:LPS export ABC transporter protein LptC